MTGLQISLNIYKNSLLNSPKYFPVKLPSLKVLKVSWKKDAETCNPVEHLTCQMEHFAEIVDNS